MTNQNNEPRDLLAELFAEDEARWDALVAEHGEEKADLLIQKSTAILRGEILNDE